MILFLFVQFILAKSITEEIHEPVDLTEDTNLDSNLDTSSWKQQNKNCRKLIMILEDDLIL